MGVRRLSVNGTIFEAELFWHSRLCYCVGRNYEKTMSIDFQYVWTIGWISSIDSITRIHMKSLSTIGQSILFDYTLKDGVREMGHLWMYPRARQAAIWASHAQECGISESHESSVTIVSSIESRYGLMSNGLHKTCLFDSSNSTGVMITCGWTSLISIPNK